MKAMQLTRVDVARQLTAYLHHEICLDALVAWTNIAMMEADFEAAYYDTTRDAVARLGLADVQAFELTWEDCASLLKQLGYDVREVL
jgi:cobyrinic acid a,c-diamide synthase